MQSVNVLRNFFSILSFFAAACSQFLSMWKWIALLFLRNFSDGYFHHTDLFFFIHVQFFSLFFSLTHLFCVCIMYSSCLHAVIVWFFMVLSMAHTYVYMHMPSLYPTHECLFCFTCIRRISRTCTHKRMQTHIRHYVFTYASQCKKNNNNNNNGNEAITIGKLRITHWQRVHLLPMMHIAWWCCCVCLISCCVYQSFDVPHTFARKKNTSPEKFE